MPIIQGKDAAVSAGLVVKVSSSTPRDVLERLTFWYPEKNGKSVMENGRLYSSDYFSGTDWRDHIQVLAELIEDDLPILRELVFQGATVTLYLWWTGKPGVPVPAVSIDDLGSLYFPGLRFMLDADWDFDNHDADHLLVSFCVYGPDPDDVAQYLGKPSKTVHAGETRNAKRKESGNHKRNAWILKTSDFCESLDIHDHINGLFDRLAPSTNDWRSFVKSSGADVDVLITWFGASGQSGPAFTPDELKKFGSYCASIDETTYAFEPEDEP